MLYSHPKILLIDHLDNVANKGKYTINQLFLNTSINSQIVEDLCFIMGVCHDIGKGTNFFQHYLLSPTHEIIGPKNHSFISAILTKEIAKEYFKKIDLERQTEDLLVYFTYMAVKRHHGNMGNLEDELCNIADGRLKDVIKQIPAFQEDAEIQEILDKLLQPLGISYQWNDFKAHVLNQAFKKEFEGFYRKCFRLKKYTKLSRKEKFNFFYLHQILYSSLLYADKSDVILKDDAVDRKKLNLNAITDYRERKKFNNPSEKINIEKNNAYFSALEHLNTAFDKNQYLYSLTLPTGLGKTITSLAVAMAMKEKLKEQDPKIIITIPFTSIIDQNFEVFADIFQSPHSDILLKHHHLSEPNYKTDDDDVTAKFNAQQSKFLIETWQSQVVVTTFVQLLETLFTNNKGKLLKFPNLCNSIIILDEVQQIPYEYWNLIRSTFQMMGNAYNCYFILMSATQPMIFKPKEEIIEIIPDYKKYFGFFNRTKLINKTQETITLEDFEIDVFDYIEANPTKDILVILNTKNAAKDFFQNLCTQLDGTDVKVFFLSTFISPYERKDIIKKIKDLAENSDNNTPIQTVIVSTQLIEAGVDISVQTVFRQLAPLDSIIQAAGRANRYNEDPNNRSEIYLYKIEELKKVTNRIYGATLMMKTENILADIDEIEEQNYLQLIEAYFVEIQKQSENVDTKLIQFIEELKFEDVGKFKFIEERETESIFVQLNQDAVDVWNTYVQIYDDVHLNKFQKKEAFAKIKATFYEFVINVPIKTWEKTYIDFDSEKTEYHFYLSSLEKPSQCYRYEEGNYRKNIGYVPENCTNINF